MIYKTQGNDPHFNAINGNQVVAYFLALIMGFAITVKSSSNPRSMNAQQRIGLTKIDIFHDMVEKGDIVIWDRQEPLKNQKGKPSYERFPFSYS